MFSIHVWRPTWPDPETKRISWYHWAGERGFVIKGVIGVAIERG